MKIAGVLALACATLLLSACGGGGADGPLGTQVANPARGVLVQNPPPRTAALTVADFTASLQASASGRDLLLLAGAPVCGVDVQYIRYGTVGGAGEATDASGALMVPTGADARCTGPRPVVLYAHGSTIARRYNLADFSDASNPAYPEALLLAALFTAQGYIVVAPNYAGYDSSSLGYHPYLNATQQSREMADVLAAARAALPGLLSPTLASAKLFVTGYSEGGHVAMATQRALQAQGIAVTAAAPMSGPYALLAQSDATFYGNVNAGSTFFLPLTFTSYQKSYGGLYATPSDVYESAFATGIESIIPGIYDFNTSVASGRLPATALFSSVPPDPAFAAITPPVTGAPTDALFAAGFGAANLVRNSVRLAYLGDALANPDGVVPVFTTGAPPAAPANPMRIALKANDLRGWTPAAPVLLCGGNADPTVFFDLNTQVMAASWAALPPGLVTVLDVDSAPTGPADPFAAAKLGFANAKAATAAAAGAGAAAAVTAAYHGTLVPPFCTAAARGFFSQF